MATAIKGIKSGQSAGEDKIIFREVESVDWRKNSLVNASVSSCVEVWQSSQRLANRCDLVTIPISKKGDRKQSTNYRGISLLSLPGKVYT